MRLEGKILVVVAHPDDETLGCGGTIWRASNHGADVTVAVFTDGVGSRWSSSAADERWNQAVVACARLGAARIVKARVDLAQMKTGIRNIDNALDTVPMLALARQVEEFVRSYEPAAVWTHHDGDLNVDHRRVHEAVLVATRPHAQPGRVQEVLAFEVPSSTECGLTPFQPTVFVDVAGSAFDAKLLAMAEYHAEQLPFPHPRSAQALRALAAVRGAQSGTLAAEAFQVVRMIR